MMPSPRFLLLLSLLMLPAGVRAEGERTARVSDVAGTLSVLGDDEAAPSSIYLNSAVQAGDTLWTDQDSQAELELEGGNWIRIAEKTKLELRELNGTPELRLWTGSLILDVSGHQDRAFHVMTPAGDLDVYRDSVVRIDLGKNNDARVSVRSGEARFTPEDGEPLRLRFSQRAYVEDNRLDGPTPFDRDDKDAFDRYQRDRTDYYVDHPAPRELERDLLGARDLRDYGSWVVVEQARFWRPYQTVDWRPYSRGYWSDMPGSGYSWVDYQPWGYTTAHYGSWVYRPIYGWLWYPGYVWSPAWVYWATWGDYYGWAPLDPWGRPCYYPPISFVMVGLVIDSRSWTFCHRDHFHHARHHRLFVEGKRPFMNGREIPQDRQHFRPVRDATEGIGLPREHVRGLIIGKDGRTARDRVIEVERSLPLGRRQAIGRRFQVTPERDIERSSRPSDLERIQKTPETPLDPERVLRGRDAERRLHLPRGTKPGANAPMPAPEIPRSQRDDPFRRTRPSPAPGPFPPGPVTPSAPRTPSTPRVIAPTPGPRVPRTPAPPRSPSTPRTPARTGLPWTPPVPVSPQFPTSPRFPNTPRFPTSPRFPAAPPFPGSPGLRTPQPARPGMRQPRGGVIRRSRTPSTEFRKQQTERRKVRIEPPASQAP